MTLTFSKIMKTSFITYFTSSLGVIFLMLFAVSFATSSSVDPGFGGLLGFPIISALYALARCNHDEKKVLKSAGDLPKIIPPKMVSFLDEHPEFLHSPDQLRNSAFHRWLNRPKLS